MTKTGKQLLEDKLNMHLVGDILSDQNCVRILMGIHNLETSQRESFKEMVKEAPQAFVLDSYSEDEDLISRKELLQKLT